MVASVIIEGTGEGGGGEGEEEGKSHLCCAWGSAIDSMTECSVGPGRMTTSDVGTSIISLADFQLLYSPFHALHRRIPAGLHSFPGRTPSSCPHPPPTSLFPPDLPWNMFAISTPPVLFISYPSNSRPSIPRRGLPALSGSAIPIPPFRRRISPLSFSGTDSSRSVIEIAVLISRVHWFASNPRCILFTPRPLHHP